MSKSITSDLNTKVRSLKWLKKEKFNWEEASVSFLVTDNEALYPNGGTKNSRSNFLQENASDTNIVKLKANNNRTRITVQQHRILGFLQLRAWKNRILVQLVQLNWNSG